MRGSSRVPASLESDVSLKTEEVPILKSMIYYTGLGGRPWQLQCNYLYNKEEKEKEKENKKKGKEKYTTMR